jgi:hypothetical protein
VPSQRSGEIRAEELPHRREAAIGPGKDDVHHGEHGEEEATSSPLVHAGVDLTETAVRDWVKQAQVDAGERDGLTSDEREELARLRQENRRLREESARHISDAQNNPERTFPSFNGKSIPGAKEPLHRLIDREEQKKNRAAAIKTCEDIWGDYSGSGLECDEYPFASTYEGANRQDSTGKNVNRYSARLIDGTDNGNGGNVIGAVYSANRMLDNDPFYVKIIP